MKWNWKEFIGLAILIYVSFMAGDWIVKAVGIDKWGIIGTLIALALPVIIVYWIWKSWLAKAVS